MARGYCEKHYDRWRRHGDPRHTRIRAHGTGTVTAEGYVLVSVRGVQRMQHRLVMEALLGRSLYDHERVHHRNGNRQDNRPENLELWSTWQPCGQRVEDKVRWARELLEVYG